MEGADSEPSGARRSLNTELEVIEEKPGKKSKAIRKWTAGQMPQTTTPVRAGSDIKTPLRQRNEEKQIKEAVPETVDNAVKDLAEQVEELRSSMQKLDDRVFEYQDDQLAYRRQQLWSLRSQIAEQRASAAKEECFVGWPSHATAQQRSQFILWRVEAAGLNAEMFETSHTARSPKLSHISIVYFKQSWMRVQLDKWFKAVYIAKKRPLNFDVNGMGTNDQIKLRPQICIWDRLKAEPLKVVLKALDIANEKAVNKDLNKLRPYWGHMMTTIHIAGFTSQCVMFVPQFFWTTPFFR